jgi:Uncharacterized protein conserved in bacteria (DUF2252)
MLQTPLAFVCSAAAMMAADLAHTPVTGLRVPACGDSNAPRPENEGVTTLRVALQLPFPIGAE